jgi:RNA polymerase sigma-70 factor, ECF subfamily
VYVSRCGACVTVALVCGGAALTEVSNTPQRWTELEARVRALLERGERDEAATLAIECLRPEALGYLRSLLEEDDANDALSLWSEAVWHDLPSFRWESSLRAWAIGVARHSASRILRKPHRSREQHLSSSAASWLAASLGTSRVNSAQQHQQLALLRASLDQEEQELLTLRIDRRLEWEEVAYILQSSSVALRKRMERLTKKLTQLARELGLLDD